MVGIIGAAVGSSPVRTLCSAFIREVLGIVLRVIRLRSPRRRVPDRAIAVTGMMLGIAVVVVAIALVPVSRTVT